MEVHGGNNLSFLGHVVESLAGNLRACAFDADFDLSPLLACAIFASEGLLHDFGTSKVEALGIISPLVDLSIFTSSNLASWKFMSDQFIGFIDIHILELEDITAFLHTWCLWVDVDLLAVDNPLIALPSGPLFVLVFVGVAIVVPQALVPGPFMLQALFGWAPVVVIIAPPLVPDTLFSVPEPWVGRHFVFVF